MRFDHLSSVEAETPTGVWNWAKHLVEDLNKFRKLWDLANMDLTGKAGQTVKVRADENGFEIVP